MGNVITFCEPKYLVQDYIDELPEYFMEGDKNFKNLCECVKKSCYQTNYLLREGILTGRFGSKIAKSFRDWVRNQQNKEDELPCGGAGVDETYDNYKELAA